MSKTSVFASISAAAILALGMTSTASAQQSFPLNIPGFIGFCKAMLPENYAALPDEILPALPPEKIF
jgi:hypothetical protein